MEDLVKSSMTTVPRLVSDLEVNAENTALINLGKMTAEIIHEINNPLTLIHGQVGLLLLQSQKETHTNKMTYEAVEKILQSTRRMNQIVDGMKKILSSADREAFEVVPVADLVKLALSFCIDRINLNEITMILESIPVSLRICCNSVKISRVIMKLLNNATDAVINLNDPWIKITVRDARDKVQIRITDCGLGISPELNTKIFNPFFTTKKSSAGTGLGLSISKAIVEAHRGTIAYTKSCGHTSFVITFPKEQ